MRKLQAFIALLLCFVLLAGCTGEKPDTSSQTQSASTGSTTQAWPGYVDPKTEYTYFHTESRAKKWEEDVIYLANSLLQDHQLLRNRAFLIEKPNYQTGSANFYNADLREAFLRQINLLIPELAELTDEQIYYSLHRILSLFGDAHTRLEYYSEEYFPIGFMYFYESGEAVYYLVAADGPKEELAYARLEAVNGYTVAQVAAMIQPYTCMETAYGLMDALGKGGVSASFLADVGMLRAAGVLASNAREATYTLINREGQRQELTVSLDRGTYHWVGLAYVQVHAIPFTGYGQHNYWLTEDLAEDVLYVRLNAFLEDPDFTYFAFSGLLSQTYRAHGPYQKIIVDLRCNGGGSEGMGFNLLFEELSRMSCDAFYILIDGGSYSMSTIFAGELVARRGDVILAGTPAGEAPGFFAGIFSEDYVLPNCGVEFTVPTQYYQPFPANEENIILPDLLIYPTLSDYQNGIDTVLEYVLNQ